MNKTTLWIASLALGFTLSSPLTTPALRADSQSSVPSAQQEQQKSQTFVGKVIKTKTGQYALLTDEQAGKGAFLDDQEKAKPFEGKTVKVTGVLESARALIHVSDIQAA